MKYLTSAVAKSKGVIEIYLDKSLCYNRLKLFRLYVDGVLKKAYTPLAFNESTSNYIYTIACESFEFDPGHLYEIATEQNYFIPVDISFLAQTEEFDIRYRFDGQLGAIYTPKKTTFRVFSPFSYGISVHIKKPGEKHWETHMMKHNFENGVFECSCSGDYDGAKYVYERMMFGQAVFVADPYSFSMGSNSRYSFVINPEKVHSMPDNKEFLPEFTSRSQAIIYECDVRDMTSLTELKNKGTFLALATAGLKDEKTKLPIGLDYLASLGVSHIQLLPVLDFQTVDEDDPFSSYNWGYDPSSYFAPEGSYSSDPNDPYARVLELRYLVSALHKEGMRVVFDVVYNHVYSNHFNPLNILCPNYYFRVDNNGNLSNGTGCGNDLESRKYMARKLIIDSMMHCLDFYDVDGFRFDLMGILDIDTVKKGYDKLVKKKPNILYYGEGWDLWTALPGDKKASYYNANQMPYASFFNDRFRDVSKGKSNESEIGVRGYLLGDTNYRDGFKHVMLGSAITLAFVPMFSRPEQSINFVECHDNHTLFDKIKIACPDDSLEEMKKRVKLNIIATLFALGVPFFHQGEEICGSKNGLPNTYNAGDEYNGFDYALLNENKDLYHFFIDAIKAKKTFIKMAGEDYESLLENNRITFEDLEHGALKVNYELSDYTVSMIINPSKQTFMYEFKDYVNLFFNDSGMVVDGEIFVRMAIVSSLSIGIYYEKKTKVVIDTDIKEVK